MVKINHKLYDRLYDENFRKFFSRKYSSLEKFLIATETHFSK